MILCYSLYKGQNSKPFLISCIVVCLLLFLCLCLLIVRPKLIDSVNFKCIFVKISVRFAIRLEYPNYGIIKKNLSSRSNAKRFVE